MKQVIASPSDHPGGLEAERSGHFGHCDAFTLVELGEGKVLSSRVLPNGAHATGGCLGPVQALRREGATSIIVKGIGGRPLMGFLEAGIEVLVGPGSRVGDVVQAFLAGEVRPIDGSGVCGGHGHGHAHGHSGGCGH